MPILTSACLVPMGPGHGTARLVAHGAVQGPDRSDCSLWHAGPPLCRGAPVQLHCTEGCAGRESCGGSTGRALPERDVVFNVVRN